MVGGRCSGFYRGRPQRVVAVMTGANRSSRVGRSGGGLRVQSQVRAGTVVGTHGRTGEPMVTDS